MKRSLEQKGRVSVLSLCLERLCELRQRVRGPRMLGTNQCIYLGYGGPQIAFCLPVPTEDSQCDSSVVEGRPQERALASVRGTVDIDGRLCLDQSLFSLSDLGMKVRESVQCNRDVGMIRR